MCLFSPQKNLLQRKHDRITRLFIQGTINKQDYFKYDLGYEKIKHLYTINLN